MCGVGGGTWIEGLEGIWGCGNLTWIKGDIGESLADS